MQIQGGYRKFENEDISYRSVIRDADDFTGKKGLDRVRLRVTEIHPCYPLQLSHVIRYGLDL
jgi:hypothetical protein